MGWAVRLTGGLLAEELVWFRLEAVFSPSVSLSDSSWSFSSSSSEPSVSDSELLSDSGK